METTFSLWPIQKQTEFGTWVCSLLMPRSNQRPEVRVTEDSVLHSGVPERPCQRCLRMLQPGPPESEPPPPPACRAVMLQRPSSLICNCWSQVKSPKASAWRIAGNNVWKGLCDSWPPSTCSTASGMSSRVTPKTLSPGSAFTGFVTWGK